MARQDDGYTFVLADEVTRTAVRYKNRYEPASFFLEQLASSKEG